MDTNVKRGKVKAICKCNGSGKRFHLRSISSKLIIHLNTKLMVSFHLIFKLDGNKMLKRLIIIHIFTLQKHYILIKRNATLSYTRLEDATGALIIFSVL